MTLGLDNAAVGATVAERTFGPFHAEDLRRYAEASGDLNPLHLDPAFARAAGFDDVIVHGMLGMALLGRLVKEHFPSHALTNFRARFRSIIHTGQPIACVARLESRQSGLTVLALIANGTEGTVLIDGTATLAPPRDA